MLTLTHSEKGEQSPALNPQVLAVGKEGFILRRVPLEDCSPLPPLGVGPGLSAVAAEIPLCPVGVLMVWLQR